MGRPTLPRDNRVRIPRCPTKKLQARTNEDKGRTGKDRQGWARKVKGRTDKEEYGQDRQGTRWAGR